MTDFPFGQDRDTRDCGFRCLYYVVSPDVPYSEWLTTLNHKNPAVSGIRFGHIMSHLRGRGFVVEPAEIKESGLFIVWANKWLPDGHYLVYHDGFVYDSVSDKPRAMPMGILKDKAGDMLCLHISKSQPKIT